MLWCALLASGCGDNIHLLDAGGLTELDADGGLLVDGGFIGDARDGGITADAPDGGASDAGTVGSDGGTVGSDGGMGGNDAGMGGNDAGMGGSDGGMGGSDGGMGGNDAGMGGSDGGMGGSDGGMGGNDAGMGGSDGGMGGNDAGMGGSDGGLGGSDAAPGDARMGDAATADAPATDAPPLPRVVINELVVTPNHDWSGAMPAYVGMAGTGSISPDDEWVELRNDGVTPVNLAGWILRVSDAEVKDTVLGMHGTLAFSVGSSITAVQPGGFVVIGNPTGTMATDTFVSLRMPDGTVIDDVEIGGLSLSRDSEQDGVGDGAPAANANGFARGSFDEAIARPVGALDSNNDIVDFEALYATPGRANTQPARPVESAAPLLLAHTTGSALAVSAAITLQFNEAVDVASIDAVGALTLTHGVVPVAAGLVKFADDDHTVVLNPIGVFPFGATITVMVKGGVGGVRDLAGNPLAADQQFTITTEAAPVDPGAARINEVCASPVQDWNDSSGGNVIPFDGVPGNGQVTSEDEWVELLNSAAGITNFSNFTLTVYAGPTLLQEARLVTRLTTSNTRIVGTGTLSAARTGDRLIIGNPVGAIPASCFLELRNASGVLIDHMELGGNFLSSDRGGDGVNNGAPGAGQDGNSSSFLDETIGRGPDGVDTGSDVLDWEYQSATIGTAN
ncbi:MAG: lamin tail domain-containing protein [Kofleriaceae bacterium]|nr:lamin tail domain-containing protein [Kofleriaceae bacterium]